MIQLSHFRICHVRVALRDLCLCEDISIVRAHLNSSTHLRVTESKTKYQSFKSSLSCADRQRINNVPCRYAVHIRGTIHVQAARIESCRTARTGCAPCSPETLRCLPSPASTREGSTCCQPLRPRESTWLRVMCCRSFSKSRAALSLGMFVGDNN